MWFEFHEMIPMLVSISVILTLLCAFKLIRAGRDQMVKRILFTAPAPPRETKRKRQWLTRSIKRREGPEDDEDHVPPVFSMTMLYENRGGTPYEKNICIHVHQALWRHATPSRGAAVVGRMPSA
ncbi:hypothetical protein SAMN06265361_101198 [Laceyella tengchongensis]|uniref:Uncharacterized protein n=1 Tax=Laceyella tengchongensis TaxID=574699 RepID=A0AA46ACW7_9BACL|nr:hypothetical protein [Laceyella tengchongensis]SMP00968.1 hypothetical protein SAMN06265361_101198 [Laceyella tengchongensis]